MSWRTDGRLFVSNLRRVSKLAADGKHRNSHSHHDDLIANVTRRGMNRERTLKTGLVAVGLLFTAGVVPLTTFFSRESAVAMIMSIYITLGAENSQEWLC